MANTTPKGRTAPALKPAQSIDLVALHGEARGDASRGRVREDVDVQ